MIRIDLLRHAKTRWNQEKKIQGREEISLSPDGIKQACAWGGILRAQNYDLILSSPMIRARQTSRIIAKKINADIEYDMDLREQNFGDWEGRMINEIRISSPGQIEHQEEKGWDFCPPGGESRCLVLNRASKAVKRAAKKYNKKHILMVSHKSVMKILIYRVLGQTFVSSEKNLLKQNYLHSLNWDSNKLIIEKLNSISL
jgi:broad specificity phosphatase PhoE